VVTPVAFPVWLRCYAPCSTARCTFARFAALFALHVARFGYAFCYTRCRLHVYVPCGRVAVATHYTRYGSYYGLRLRFTLPRLPRVATLHLHFVFIHVTFTFALLFDCLCRCCYVDAPHGFHRSRIVRYVALPRLGVYVVRCTLHVLLLFVRCCCYVVGTFVVVVCCYCHLMLLRCCYCYIVVVAIYTLGTFTLSL